MTPKRVRTMDLEDPFVASFEGMCELLSIEIGPERRAQLEALDINGLEALRALVQRERRWP